MDTAQYDYLFKYIMVGDTSVGKSTLLWMFVDRKIKDENQPTLGVQFASKRISYNNKIIKLQIWDTAGQEAFRTITRSYYKNTIGVILMFDVTNRKSFENIESWLSEIKDHVNESVQIIIVGNKTDLPHKIRQQQVKSLGRPYFLTSAKQDENVQDPFMELVDKILKKLQSNQIDLTDHHCGVRVGRGSKEQSKQDVSLRVEKRKEKSSCC